MIDALLSILPIYFALLHVNAYNGVIEHIINETSPLPDRLTDVSKTSTVFDKAKDMEHMTARPLDIKHIMA